MSFITIIPARSGSSRLPNKPLLDIGGKPMVVRTAEQAALSNTRRIIIATDDQQILSTVRQYGLDAILTRTDHLTGTDRLAEVATQLQLDPDSIVVNVQGDEPLINPEYINAVAAMLSDRPQAAIATCACPLTDADAFFNPNVVKVVCDQHQRALYFSRAPIPWARDALSQGQRLLAPNLPALHHIGLYAYRADFLRQFPNLPSGPLELFESLEQLRALENGYSIVVQVMNEAPAAGVDTLQDLARVRGLFLNRL